MAPQRNLNLPEIVPLFPLPGVILLPRGQLPLNVFEPRYLALVDDALKSERLIGIVQPQAGAEGARPALFEVGGLGRITAFAETDNGRYLITLSGVSRFRIIRELTVLTPYRQVQADFRPFEADRAPSPDAPGLDRAALLKALKRYFTVNRIDADWDSIERAPIEGLVNSLSMIAPVPPPEKQALLEAQTVGDRAQTLIALIELALAGQMPPDTQKPN